MSFKELEMKLTNLNLGDYVFDPLCFDTLDSVYYSISDDDYIKITKCDNNPNFIVVTKVENCNEEKMVVIDTTHTRDLSEEILLLLKS